MRQIILDTETTGIDPKEGHRIIEIGAVEVINRRLTGRHYHQYINPERLIDSEAIEVHGITDERVAQEPKFIDIVDAFWDFVKGAELVIHNAPFDVGFIDHELAMVNAQREQALGPVREFCGVLDTLQMARQRHPGQRNNLDALCKRYDIDNTQRVLHGALLDAEILAEVYLAMTGGQTALMLGSQENTDQKDKSTTTSASNVKHIDVPEGSLRVVMPSEAEMEAHQRKLDQLRQKAGSCQWDVLNEQ